jgi:putative thioredoxin
MSVSHWVVNVGDEDFEREVIQRSREVPVVVDFWAAWCGPCRALTPILVRQVEARGGAVILAKVNVDEAPGVAAAYQVQGIPLVIGFKDGKPASEFTGLLPEDQVGQFLDSLRPTDAERQAREAAALEKDRPEEAENLYRAAVAADPHNEAARVGLARLLVGRGADAEAEEVLGEVGVVGETGEEAEKLRGLLKLRALARPFGDEASARKALEASPKSFDARYRLGTILAAQGKYEEALKTLLSAAELMTPGGPGKVREAMVDVFQQVGPQSPIANEYRARLSELLY